MEAARAIQNGWKKGRPNDEVRLLPICDGGDGFGETLADIEQAKAMICQTIDAAHRPISATWWWQEKHKLAIVESAGIIGLAQLPPEKYHPFELDTFGLGTVLEEISQHGARTCVVGIGGSATNDGGFGMARALGWKFYSEDESEISAWNQLDKVSSVVGPERSHLFENCIIASDVENLLLGKEGASRIYGPQKGLKPDDMQKSEACLEALSATVDAFVNHRWSLEPGSGAAGGLGYGLMAFLGGKAQSGFDLFAKRVSLSNQLDWADLVITGEGSLDPSSLMGKGVGSIAQECAKIGKNCIGVAGKANITKELSHLFQNIYAITPHFTDPQSAQSSAPKWLTLLAEKASKDIQS